MLSSKSIRMEAFPQVDRVRVIDFETYYDRQYSLTKLTSEEYIRDPRFETIGFAYQDFRLDGRPLMQEPMWVTGDEAHIAEVIRNGMDWDGVCAVAHNASFDMPILSWRYGVLPEAMLCTLDMSRPLFGFEVGGSLKAVAEKLGAGVKGTEVENALGKRRTDFSPEEMHRYAEYCKNDVALTGDIFFKLLDGYPQGELYIIDLLLRMKAEPVLELDVGMLREALVDLKENRIALVKDALRRAAKASPKIATRIIDLSEKGESLSKIFSSNPMFAEILRALGYGVPMKTSPTTGEPIPALGKKDPEFLAFEEEHADDPVLQVVIAARKKTKSTLLESRIQRFIDIGERGPLPIPLRYYAAHTGRVGGSDSLNLQNMPRGSVLRKSIMAPEGHTLVVADSGQIEARGVAWLAGQTDLLKLFADGEDVYKHMASKIYHKSVEEITKDERQVGKLCIAEGMPVLTDSGWKPIEKVTLEDRVWDGLEYVEHGGVIAKGIKEVITYMGLTATPDHEVWTVDGEKRPLAEAKELGLELMSAFWEPLSPEPPDCGFDYKSTTGVIKARVYDILNAGPRHRFTCAGWVVSNCVLGLGYGMGHRKYKDVVKQWLGMDISEDESKNIVTTYREVNHAIKRYWRLCDDAIREVAAGGSVQLGPNPECRLLFQPKDDEGPARIQLPSGHYLRYPGLKWDDEDESWVFFQRRGRNMEKKYLHGGVLTENMVQALARCVVFEQMAAIDKKLRKAQEKYGGIWKTVLTVHDEIVVCVPEEHGERVLELMLKAMTTPPKWAQGWPLAAEGDIAKRYGEAK